MELLSVKINKNISMFTKTRYCCYSRFTGLYSLHCYKASQKLYISCTGESLRQVYTNCIFAVDGFTCASKEVFCFISVKKKRPLLRDDLFTVVGTLS